MRSPPTRGGWGGAVWGKGTPASLFLRHAGSRRTWRRGFLGKETMSRLPRLPACTPASASATLSTFFIFSCFREGGAEGGWRYTSSEHLFARNKERVSLEGGGFQTSAAWVPMNHGAPGSACARGCEACLSKLFLLFTRDDPVGPGAAAEQRHSTQTRHAFFIGLSSSASEHTDALRGTPTHKHTAMWLWMCVSSAVWSSPLRSAVSRRLVITRKWKSWRQTNT